MRAIQHHTRRNHVAIHDPPKRRHLMTRVTTDDTGPTMINDEEQNYPANQAGQADLDSGLAGVSTT